MKVNKSDEILEILTVPDADSAGIGDFRSPVAVPVKTLNKNLKSFTKKLGEILPDISDIKNYELSEVNVSVNITAKGELQLVGVVKGGAEINGGLSLKFKRTDSL